MVQKEKQVKSYTRKSKSGKQVQVKSYSAKYNSAEDMVKEALKQKKGAGKELEKLKNKKPAAQKEEEAKSPYDEYGFTKEEFKEWYEGTGSKADKKVEKALRKVMGTKAYNAFSDKAADEYKKGGAHRFFTKGLEEMKASTSADKKSVTSAKETKSRLDKESTGEKTPKRPKKSTKSSSETKAKDGFSSLSDDDLYRMRDEHKGKEPQRNSKAYRSLDKKVNDAMAKCSKVGKEFGYDSKEYKQAEKEFNNALKERSKWYDTKEGKKFREEYSAYQSKAASYSKEISKREKAANEATERELRKLGIATSAFGYTGGERGNGVLSMSYHGGFGKRADKFIQKLKDKGWKKETNDVNLSPDGSSQTTKDRYVSPDGKYVFTYHESWGSYPGDNHFTFRLGKKK